ncbi:hypothetical protein GW17_00060009 [Ensete ventricosum]|nr:hypothetical protein GW17_00060009 [Ensete ventricosum]
MAWLPARGGRPWPDYLQGAPGCGQPPVRGGQPWVWPATANRGYGRLRPTRKGQPAVASLQGVAARDQPCRQQGRQRRPQRWLPLGRAVADRKGQLSPAQG